MYFWRQPRAEKRRTVVTESIKSQEVFTMNRYLPVRKVYAREVLDSRGNPTVEAEVTVGEGIVGKEGYRCV